MFVPGRVVVVMLVVVSGSGGCRCGCSLSVLLICVLIVLVVVAAPLGDFQAISWSALWDQGINAEMYHKVFQPSTQTLQPTCMQWMVF